MISCYSTEQHVAVHQVEPDGRPFQKPAVAEANPFNEEGVWWICRVLVPASRRGKGIGSRIVQRLLEELRAKGAKAVVVAPGGYNANYNSQVRFYEQQGFKRVDEDGLFRKELQ